MDRVQIDASRSCPYSRVRSSLGAENGKKSNSSEVSSDAESWTATLPCVFTDSLFALTIEAEFFIVGITQGGTLSLTFSGRRSEEVHAPAGGWRSRKLRIGAKGHEVAIPVTGRLDCPHSQVLLVTPNIPVGVFLTPQIFSQVSGAVLRLRPGPLIAKTDVDRTAVWGMSLVSQISAARETVPGRGD